MPNDGDFIKKLKDIDFDSEYTDLDSYKELLFQMNKEFFLKKSQLKKLIDEKYEYSNYNYDRLLNIAENLDLMFNKEYKSTLSIIHLAYKNNVVIDQVLKNKFKTLLSIINKISNLYDDLVLNLYLSDKNDNQKKINIVKDMDTLIKDVKYYK